MERNMTNTRRTDKYMYWIEGKRNGMEYDVNVMWYNNNINRNKIYVMKKKKNRNNSDKHNNNTHNNYNNYDNNNITS